MNTRGIPGVDGDAVRAFWRKELGCGQWMGEDLMFALARRFVERVTLTAPDGFAAVRGRGVIYLANHQVGVESLLFTLLVSGLHGLIVKSVAKQEHRDSWVGQFLAGNFACPDLAVAPDLLVLVDRDNPRAVLRALSDACEHVAADRNTLLVHVEGTRATRCRQPVTVLSSVLLSLAVRANVPVVPARFAGGLPLEPTDERLEFPVGYGRQAVYLGAPILPGELEPLSTADRRDLVLNALHGLGPDWETESPADGDAAFAQDVAELTAAAGITETQAVLRLVLDTLPDGGADTRRLHAAVHDPHGPELPPWLARCARDLLGLPVPGL